MSSRKTSIFYFLFLSVLSVLLGSCGDNVQRGLAPTPIAFGNINQVTVIADSSTWNGPVGDTIDYYYASAYPILPQPEPLFDLRLLTPQDLRRDPIKRELRTYLIVANLSDPDSETARMVREDLGEERLQAELENGFGSTVGRNKWAEGQQLIYLYGENQQQLVEGIVRSFPAVAKRIADADRDRIDATAYFNGEDRELMDLVRQRMNARMRVPREYFEAPVEDSTVVWLRKDTPEGSNNILLYRVPYTDQAQLTRENLKRLRDSLGRAYVSSTLPNTYMKINDEDLPLFTEQTEINGNYALEARGVWEIENDFMGGPFVSYLIYDEEKQALLFADGFVHAPGEDKRDRMQELEYVLRSIRF